MAETFEQMAAEKYPDYDYRKFSSPEMDKAAEERVGLQRAAYIEGLKDAGVGGWVDDSIDVMQLNIGKLEINCFDEDSEMSIRVGKSGYQSLSVEEAKEVANFFLSHIKNETEANSTSHLGNLKQKEQK